MFQGGFQGEHLLFGMDHVLAYDAAHGFRVTGFHGLDQLALVGDAALAQDRLRLQVDVAADRQFFQ